MILAEVVLGADYADVIDWIFVILAGIWEDYCVGHILIPLLEFFWKVGLISFLCDFSENSVKFKGFLPSLFYK